MKNSEFWKSLSARCGVILVGAVLLLSDTIVRAQPGPPNGISANAWRQIQAIQQEKTTYTPVQRKMDSHFVHHLKQNRGQLPPEIANIPSHVRFETDNRVLVDLDATVTDELLGQIQAAGGTVLDSVPNFHAIRAQIPLEAVEALAASTNVIFIKQAVQARTRTGSVESEGDFTHGAINARTNFGVSGSGIKVGVLSDSVKNLSTSQATGDLPANVTVLPGQSGTSISGNEGEGTAMLEIVHDLAPGAQLFFATAFASEASFAQNILNLRSNGCNIIVDDVGYFDEPAFQDGIIAQAVNSVTADGALYFSSAGNGGRLDAGTAAVWEGNFVDGGAVGSPLIHGRVDETGGRLHNFGSATYDTLVGPAATYYVNLFWADPWGASTNDYDLFALNSSGSQIDDYSAGPQSGTQNPYEICTAHANDRIVIVKFSGATRFLHLELLSNGYGALSTSTAGDIRGHNVATNAFAVGAVDVHIAYPNLFNSSSTNEDFSSDGPRRMFFSANGSPITPGNFTNTGGAIRFKPDISAADGASNSVAGFNPFYGTSAAAPHAAAIAALLWSYSPSLTTVQIRAALTNSAIDIHAPGWDRNSGWGIVMPGAAIQWVAGGMSNPPPVVSFTSGPTNGAVPLVVNFTNLTIGATTYNWNFGDNQTNASTNPSHTYTNAGIYSVTLTAVGAGGTNSLTRTNYIVVTNVPPSISAQPQNLLVNQGSNATFNVTASGTAPLNYQWRFNTTNIAGATGTNYTRTNAQPADAGNYTVVITNAGGSITSAIATLTVIIPPPTASFIAAPTNGMSLLTVYFTNLTSGATNYIWNFGDGHTNTSANPTNVYNSAGAYTVSLTANGAGGQTIFTRTNYIVLSNSSPVLLPITNRTVVETTLLTVNAGASDADVNQTLTFSLTNAPIGAAINSTNGTFTWTPAETQGPGTNSITVRVTDNGVPPLSVVQTFTVTVLESNQPPVLTTISNQTIYELTTLVITNVASDSDVPANTLTFSLDAGAPTNAVINPTNGILSWTPNESQAPGNNSITVRVTDNGVPPLSATQSFTVTVLESNQPPVLTAISNQTIYELTTLTITNVASDPDIPANTLTFSLDVGAPTNAAIDATNGVFTWTPTEAQGPGSNYVSVIVTDNGSPFLSTTQSFAIIVLESNEPPVLAAIADRTVHAGTTVIVTNSATDPDLPANSLAFSLDAGAPAGASINATNGIFTWVPDAMSVSASNGFTVRVTDDGTPPLSDAKPFNVIVVPPPTFMPVSLSNNVLTISWNAITGQTYRVQYSTNLAETNWADLPPDVTATDVTASKLDSIGSDAQRFYRVLVLP